MRKKLAVIAIGGNSLIKHRSKQTVEDQYHAICETMTHLVDLVEMGYQLLITHGNGPQVGFIMLRSEIAREQVGLHIVPLSSCVADTQGAIGLQIQQALTDELWKRGLAAKAVTLVTQVEVSPLDPGFVLPDKPIGEFYSEEQLTKLREQHPEWILKQDANRGYRRVVASPIPLKIVEEEAVIALLENDFHVIAAGGGGVPVVRSDIGLTSVDAVIDKDKTAALLAGNLHAPLLVISTAVEQVMLNFGTAAEQSLGEVQMVEMEKYLHAGHFAPGSMAPKIEAAIAFIKNGGERVIITSPENIGEAIRHGKGTQIVP
ncbi:carbamate kinase [Desulfocapsa sulfexigens DSM 10523]|uniref:Carbamate kinase n=1 Tax=Desulfocapsa sulfexigens (strain DSM 10523 / SB164P1) TaxID=1167006 RepID=M1P315_DESSD|nr:carbamate kinase [Desulfocapsa sulfexigens]AGF77868.1 carbamate kinase [Desulfocapsa sulfexigens DSM 10523]